MSTFLLYSVILGIFKLKAAKKIIQPTDLSGPLSSACRSVSDAWNLKRLDSINLNGTGTVIAILDTTIDHRYFTGKKITDKAADFACSDIMVIDCLPNLSVASTVHGTICSAIAVGLQCETETGVIPRGVAPGAKLIVYRIADQNGCNTDAILMALQSIQNASEENGIKIDVVSISYDCDEKSKDMIQTKIDELTKKGITIVAAAGNRGQYQTRACIPACFDNVISVGALDENGRKAPYTPEVKIDVYAPGVFPANYEGTSYAAPAVAGLVLLLKQWANYVGSPAKENINRVDFLHKIFKKEMVVKSDSGADVFEPVEFFMRMKDNPTMFNDIVRDEENTMEY